MNWNFWPFNRSDEGRIEYGVCDGYGTYVDLDVKEKELPMENAPDSQSPPHTHEWDLWEITKEGKIVRCADTSEWNSEETVLGTYLDQRRRCKTCGKYELDTQVSYAVKDY